MASKGALATPFSYRHRLSLVSPQGDKLFCHSFLAILARVYHTRAKDRGLYVPLQSYLFAKALKAIIMSSVSITTGISTSYIGLTEISPDMTTTNIGRIRRVNKQTHASLATAAKS